MYLNHSESHSLGRLLYTATTSRTSSPRGLRAARLAEAFEAADLAQAEGPAVHASEMGQASKTASHRSAGREE